MPVGRLPPLGRMTKRSQFRRRLPHDLAQADCRQSAQCVQEYGAKNGRRQATIPLQRRAPWPDIRNSVERELVLRLASLQWRLRRSTTIETGLFEIQADKLSELTNERQIAPTSRQIVYAVFGQPSAQRHRVSASSSVTAEETIECTGQAANPYVYLARSYSSPICRISRSIVSVATKQRSGVRSLKRSSHSTRWIAANHKNVAADLS